MSQFYPEDKWVVANDLNIHYLDWGGDKTKKPLILMHGIGGPAPLFDEISPEFSDKWHVIALDARGCGDSDWSRGGYSVQNFASDLAAFANVTGLYPFDYYGHSQGSRIGIALGAYYGDFISHLALGDYGPMPDPSPAGKATANQRMTKGAKEKPRGFFTPEQAFDWHKESEPTLNNDQLWQVVKYTYRTNWDGILIPKTDPEIKWLLGRTALKEGEFLWDCVSRISCNTMIVRGETSTVLDLNQANEMATKIPSNKGIVKEIDGAGHGLHSENREGTVKALREFFSGQNS
ncbi:MAG: alpha/beta hydrolase [SAR202 cluster bacterium]|nr:alpha/beta hydrolase [SAR202 cluster bacterium]